MDKSLLDLLVCPVSKAPLVLDEANDRLVCRASMLAYPIRDGIPVLLEEQSVELEPADLEGLSK